MINAEKFKDELLEILSENRYIEVDKSNRKIRKCTGNNCPKCMFGITALGKGRDSCSIAAMLWLLSEYKESIKLSKLEYELLRHLYKKDYRYIVREKSERMFAYKGRPFKVFGHSWNKEHGEKLGFLNLYDFSYLFQFVNWEDEKPTSIKDVLDNCEVVDDDNES